jgi:hypothetical protein
MIGGVEGVVEREDTKPAQFFQWYPKKCKKSFNLSL